ncbi:hypothetical protein Glove_195g50 [Diversispora epigaea]|uniref:Uncharacterized protein n=1 Tax=Diversispora epigaea TaxID=1348612 RepID=A0A397IUJ0_9GLOM|nr:hypothetical protein Glove_195g50 [Diversispora epigaea]
MFKDKYALQYDEKYEKELVNKPGELFKFHSSKTSDSEKYSLPKILDYKKVAADHLREMSMKMYDIVIFTQQFVKYFSLFLKKLIKSTIEIRWPEKLLITTELEATAIHCMQLNKGFALLKDKSYMIVNCGVDILITLKFISTDVLGEVTGHNKQQHYSQTRYLMEEFWKRAASPFSGIEQDFKLFELDLEELRPSIVRYVIGSYKEKLEKDEWIIDFDNGDEYYALSFAAIVRGAVEYGLNRLR